MRSRLLPLFAAAPLALSLTGCSGEGSVSEGAGKADTTIAVTSSDRGCELSSAKATPGKVAFQVTNTGTKPTEFYLYSGSDIVGEVENIGPGLTRTLTVDVTAGTYTSACKPGQKGDGIRADFTVG